jgi:hypothetical protein
MKIGSKVSYLMKIPNSNETKEKLHHRSEQMKFLEHYLSWITDDMLSLSICGSILLCMLQLSKADEFSSLPFLPFFLSTSYSMKNAVSGADLQLYLSVKFILLKERNWVLS